MSWFKQKTDPQQDKKSQMIEKMKTMAPNVKPNQIKIWESMTFSQLEAKYFALAADKIKESRRERKIIGGKEIVVPRKNRDYDR